jgi:hypothetical protein
MTAEEKRIKTREYRKRWKDKHPNHQTPDIEERNIWYKILSRCFRPKDKKYKDYGGRGITMCKEWLDFKVFLKDMGKRPSKKHSIDRINNDGNYEPANCRWATSQVQNNNRRDNVYLTAFNETLTVAQWARKLNLHRPTIYQRLRDGFSNEEALSKESFCTTNMVSYKGLTKSLPEWAKVFGLTYNTVYQRFKRGLELENVFKKS